MYISPWSFIFVIPLIFVFTIYLELKAFDEKLQPEDIGSKSGIKVRIRHLKRAAETARTLGFREYKVYWLKTLAPAVVAVFKHETEPFFLMAQHSGMKMTFEYRTYFDRGILDTASSHTSFLLPFLPGNYGQLKSTQNLEVLLNAHREGYNFLKENNHIPRSLSIEDEIKTNLDGFKATVKNTMKLDAWPFRAAWWILSGNGKKYEKKLSEQVASGMTKLDWEGTNGD